MMQNAFYFTSKALFLLKISNFLSCHVARRLNEKDTVNFKFYDVTAWLTSNRNVHIAQYFKNERQPDNEIWSVNRM